MNAVTYFFKAVKAAWLHGAALARLENLQVVTSIPLGDMVEAYAWAKGLGWRPGLPIGQGIPSKPLRDEMEKVFKKWRCDKCNASAWRGQVLYLEPDGLAYFMECAGCDNSEYVMRG